MAKAGIPGTLLIVKRPGEKFPFTFPGTPTLVLLDPQGKVLYVWDGELHGTGLEDFVKKFS